MSRPLPQERFLDGARAGMGIALEEVWAWLRFLPQLGELAEISRGLDHKGQSELKGKVTRSTTGVPKVLVNITPASRGPWCLKAVLDWKGRPVSSRLLTVRSRSQEPSPRFLWALCNSPVANAFIYTNSKELEVKVGALRRMPVPRVTRTQTEAIEEAVRGYLREMEGRSRETASGDEQKKRLLLQVDAELLRLYALPPRLERQLLDLFEGEQRQGVSFRFDAYFPRDFEPWIPLQVYLSAEYGRSTAGHLAARHRDVTSATLLGALRNAVEAYEVE